MKPIKCIFIFIQLFFPFFIFGSNIPVTSPETTTNIKFEENKKHLDTKVLYVAELRKGGKVFLEKNAFTYLFWNSLEVENLHHPLKDNSEIAKNNTTVHFHSFKANFLNANPKVQVSATKKEKYYKNYFIGNDTSKWESEVKIYEEINYSELYSSIDMKVYSTNRNLKYDFIVHPQGNAGEIKINYTGADKLFLEKGILNIQTSIGTITELKPFAYQLIEGKKIEIVCDYLIKENTVEFSFPKGYNKKEDLIIDPVLVCSTFTGSTADNWGYTATYDAAGNIYTGGIVAGFGYPTSAGAFQTSFGGGGSGGYPYPFDISITKYNTIGSAILYSTYLGGMDNEQPGSIFVDKNNNLFILGRTYSSNYPVVAGSYDVSYNGGADIIISKLNSTGTALLASTFVGGAGDDGVNIESNFFIWSSLKYNYGDDSRCDIMTDNVGDCYVSGSTRSTDFPTTLGAFSTTFQGAQDGCVFKMDNNLTTLKWSTFLGGDADDAAYYLDIDPNKNVYVSGGTNSSNFPTTAGTFNTTFQGGLADGFVTHLKADGSAVLQSTYIGTADYDQAYFVQLDNDYNVYICGQSAGGYPVTAGVYSNPNSGQFMHKMNPTLDTTLFSTVYGSGNPQPNYSPSAFMVDICGNIYTAGWGGQCITAGNTGSTTGLPVTPDAFQATTDGCDFYFFVLKKDATSLLYATYFGGGAPTEEHVDGGTSRFDKRGVMYQDVCAACNATSCPTCTGANVFPTTPTAWSRYNNSINCNNAVIKMDFKLIQLIATASTTQGTTYCEGQTVTFQNQSFGAQNYVWTFGDGSPKSTLQNPAHTYTGTGVYNVTLVAIDSASCHFSDTTHLTITVLPYPKLSLGNDTVICGNTPFLLDAKNMGCAYLWSTGSTTQTISVTTSGTYWVTITNGICPLIDTININFISPPILNDTTLCAGTLLLQSSTLGANYLWSTGATTQTIFVSTSGTYWESFTSGTCVLADTMDVIFIPYPLATLNDTIRCSGQQITLDAGNAGSTYLWNTGDTTQTILVDTTGLFFVAISNAFCGIVDSINVQTLAKPNLGKDTTLCDGINLILNSENLGSIYLWSTGETTQSITVSNQGTYWVTSSIIGCSVADTIVVNYVSYPIVSLGNDTVLCDGQKLLLDAKNINDNYLWNTGATTQTINVTSTGTYFVMVNNGYCSASDSIFVDVLNKPNLGRDTTICDETAFLILRGNENANAAYLWSTGATTQNITIDEVGTYWVTSTLGNCAYADTIEVSGRFVGSFLFVPNAFTPNNDGLNDSFKAVAVEDNITSYDMKVFNRWGELIYETKDISKAWDGKYKDKIVELDVYVWVIDYSTLCSENKTIHRVGAVLVDR